jgi:hypothetical protein
MPYFTVAEFRAEESSVANADHYPDARLTQARDMAEEWFEDAARVAFVPRTTTETVSGNGETVLFVSANKVRTLTQAVDLGVAIDVAGVRKAGLRSFYRAEGWLEGIANLTVTYTHGFDAPPKRVRDVVMTMAKFEVIDGPYDERTVRRGGGGSDLGVSDLTVAGQKGAVFSVPDANAALALYGYPELGVG